MKYVKISDKVITELKIQINESFESGFTSGLQIVEKALIWLSGSDVTKEDVYKWIIRETESKCKRENVKIPEWISGYKL